MAGPIESFAEQLLAGTKQGTVEWKLTNEPNVLEVRADSGRVKLVDVAEDTVRIEIFDQEGNAVGSAASDPMAPGSWQSWETALRELFPIALLQARGTTDVLSKLEDELNLKPDIPF